MKFKIQSAVALIMMAVIPMVQAQAQAVTVNSAINQLNYSLSVKWDGKDQAVRKAAFQTFANQLAQLRKQGVSDAQILASLKSKMPDAQTASDVQALASIAKEKKLSPEDTNKLVMQYVEKAETNGASWSDTATYTVVAVSIILLIAVVIAAGGSVTVVDDQPTYYDTETCGYDDFGNYYCYYN